MRRQAGLMAAFDLACLTEPLPMRDPRIEQGWHNEYDRLGIEARDLAAAKCAVLPDEFASAEKLAPT